MDSVFNNVTYTETAETEREALAFCRVLGLDENSKLTKAPDGKRISKPYFLQAEELAPGHEQILIHGARCIKVDDNQATSIMKDKYVAVYGNEVEMVMGNSEITYSGNQTVTNIGTKLSTHVGAVLEQHTSPRTINQPTSWFQVVDSSLVVQLVNSSLIAEYVGASIGYHWVSGHMFSLGLIQTEAKMLDNGLYVFKASGTAARAVLDAAVCNIRPVTTELGPEFRLGPLLSAPPALPAN